MFRSYVCVCGGGNNNNCDSEFVFKQIMLRLGTITNLFYTKFICCDHNNFARNFLSIAHRIIILFQIHSQCWSYNIVFWFSAFTWAICCCSFCYFSHFPNISNSQKFVSTLKEANKFTSFKPIFNLMPMQYKNH